MATKQHVVDKFNTNNEGDSQPLMKIQRTNLWLNSLLDSYPEEL